ncbi:MAG TPA: twin-arginine translocase TatA/TatE family subunit [Acidobacteriota bacterium]
MPSLGLPELLVIMGIAILVFGARRLPEIGAGLGKGITSFKKALKGAGEEEEDASRASERSSSSSEK